jgi:predicted neuraminidase
VNLIQLILKINKMEKKETFMLKILTVLFLALFVITYSYSQEPYFEREEIFPYQHEHVHGSTIVELPNGDLLVSWFQGSGERWADDVRIMGSRKKNNSDNWSPPFLMADVKEFPDINPVLFIDGKNRLWLMWYTVIANQWSTSLINYRISKDYMDMDGAPSWDWQENLMVKPGDKTEYGILFGDSFVESVNRQLDEYTEYLKSFTDAELIERWERRAERIRSLAAGEDMSLGGRGMAEGEERGFPYFRRMGWQTRSKPVITSSCRMIVPLYSDGFGFSLMAITDDWGENWFFSEPLVGTGIQPTIAETGSGKLVTYMRDNGPPPKRLQVSYSNDDGKSWSVMKNSELYNPNSAPDVVTLDDGSWALIYNDTESGRHSLVVSLSEDGGETWPWTKTVEVDEPESMSAHYPAIIQGVDGILHASYSYFTDNSRRKNIIYATFNKEWIKQE